MINELIKKTTDTFKGQPALKSSAAPEKRAVDPKPIDTTPRGLAKAAAEAAGFVPGAEYQGQTLRHRPPNQKMLWATIDNWGENVLFGVQNQLDWSAGERIWGHYAGPDTQGRLLFENRQGIRRKKFRS